MVKLNQTKRIQSAWELHERDGISGRATADLAALARSRPNASIVVRDCPTKWCV